MSYWFRAHYSNYQQLENVQNTENNLYSLMVTFSAGVGGLLFGYEVGAISQVLRMPSFQKYFGMIDSLGNRTAEAPFVEGLVTFILLFGCTIGSVVVSHLADEYGRKYSILSAGIVFFIGSLIQSLSINIPLFFYGRAISGFSIGILSMIVPLYISETAETKIRGRMVTIQQLMITIGILIASIVNAEIILFYQKQGILNDAAWRWCLGMQAFPSLLLILSTFLIPESPRWLALKGDKLVCLDILSKLRGVPTDDTCLLNEFDQIVNGVELEKEIGPGTWQELVSKSNFERLSSAILIQSFQQWTGINMILYYQSSLLQKMGLSENDALIKFTIANNIVNVLATFPGMYLIEKIGRKKLLIIGGLGIGLSHFIVSVSITLGEMGFKTMYIFAIASIYSFLIFYGSTWGPIGNENLI
jgi:sugar porter (SP) family MFS transporter